MGAWASLLRAHRCLTTALDAELRTSARMGLDEYDVLFQLRSAGEPVRMSDLANRALISRPSTTRIVDRLMRRGWVERRHDERDRRVVLVRLTPEGRRAQGRAARVHLDGIARLVGDPLAGHDVRALAAALDAIGPQA